MAVYNAEISIGDLRQRGVAARHIVGALAASAGLLAPGRDAFPSELLAGFQLAAVGTKSVNFDSATLNFVQEA
jgi:hypothetical protein